MPISYEEAVKAQKQIEDNLLTDPNVVSIGVVEEVSPLGQKTGDYVIQVGVLSTEIHENALKHGHSLIPKEHVIYLNNGHSLEKHIHIHVVKEGKIEALSKETTVARTEDIPSAIDDLSTLTATTLDSTSRVRPVTSGHSIGHSNTTAGTLGILLEYTGGPNVGKAFILSNNHVLAANNLAYVGDHIIQPSKHDGGKAGKDTIGYLQRWVPIIFSQGSNYVDAAVAEVIGGLNWIKYANPIVKNIGYPKDYTEAELSMSVEKNGRTTGYTQGKIASINETIKVSYPTGMAIFKHQIRTTSMSKGGDSGSCLFEQKTQKPVGLLFAGSDSASYFNHFGKVISSLQSSQTNYYPNRKSHTFAQEEYSLRVLTFNNRNYTTSSSTIYSHSSTTSTYRSVNNVGIRTTSLSTMSSFSKGIKCAGLLASFGTYAVSKAMEQSNKHTASTTSFLTNRRKFK